jgi:shikimate dehydrogenase
MFENYSGATRLIPVVGDPIAQVKSPFGMTEAFEARGRDLICVPMQVAASDFAAFYETMRRMKNVDGLIVTIPHKTTAAHLTPHLSGRAGFLETANTLRRRPDGAFEGDMFDGVGFVEAAKAKGAVLKGKRALLVGVGGAGKAIAHAVAEAGVASLTLHDLDQARAEELAARLRSVGHSVTIGSNDPTGFDLVFNATPLGMKPTDAMPIQGGALRANMFVGDVVTKPEVPALIAHARGLGCHTSTGVDMFEKVRDLMVDYLLGAGR